MEKQAKIMIRGEQRCEGETQAIELMTDGVYSEENGVYRISYEETEMTGMDGVTTTFEVHEDRVVLIRKGTLESQMVFVIGESNDSLYDLGFGALMVTVCARSLQADLTHDGGTMELEYTVEVEHSEMSINAYRIEVRPLPEA